MKKLSIITALALTFTPLKSNAGDKEWSVVGKVLTGIFAIKVLENAVSPTHTTHHYHATSQPIVVQQPVTTTTVVQQPVTTTTTVVQQPVTTTTTVVQQPVTTTVIQQPVVVQQPPVIYCPPPRRSTITLNFGLGSRRSRHSHVHHNIYSHTHTYGSHFHVP